MIKKRLLQTLQTRKSHQTARRKRGFLLIEALVAITLLFIAGFSFFELQQLITLKIRAQYLRIEKERVESLALGYLVENLYKKTFPWGILEQGGEQNATFKEAPNWQATYTFSFEDDTSDKPHTVFLLNVAISVNQLSQQDDLQTTTADKKIYTFCVTKNS